MESPLRCSDHHDAGDRAALPPAHPPMSRLHGAHPTQIGAEKRCTRFFGFLGHWVGRALFFMYVGTTVMDGGTWHAVIRATGGARDPPRERPAPSRRRADALLGL